METKFVVTKGDAPDERGELSAVFSTFDIVDRDGDIVQRSAFTDGQAVPLTWAHDWTRPIGAGTVRVRRDRAEFHGHLFMDTEDGVQAYRKLKGLGPLAEYSWGFRITEAEPAERDGKPVRLIKGAEVMEVSWALIGANPQTRTLSLKADSALDPEDDDIDLAAVWTTAYVNNLPDSAFAVILPGGSKDSEGKTVPRSLRKLPHHDSGGGLDMAHLRNALSREPQTDMPAGAHATASAHLKRHASGAGVGEAAAHDHADDERKHPARLRVRDHARVRELLAEIASVLDPPEADEAEPDPEPKGLNPAATALLATLESYAANLARAPDGELAHHAAGAATVARKLAAAAVTVGERARKARHLAADSPRDLYRAFTEMEARIAPFATRPSPEGRGEN